MNIGSLTNSLDAQSSLYCHRTCGSKWQHIKEITATATTFFPFISTPYFLCLGAKTPIKHKHTIAISSLTRMEIQILQTITSVVQRVFTQGTPTISVVNGLRHSVSASNRFVTSNAPAQSQRSVIISFLKEVKGTGRTTTHAPFFLFCNTPPHAQCVIWGQAGTYLGISTFFGDVTMNPPFLEKTRDRATTKGVRRAKK